MYTVAQILEQEGVLRKVLQLQQQDLLDVEGASLVFKRLVELMGGEELRALELIGKE